MNRKRIAAVAAATIVAVGGAVAVAPHLSKIKCAEVTGRGAFDPIVHRNESPPSGHNHTFFGSKTLPNLPNPDAAEFLDLYGKGTACLNPSDTAGYWVPTLYYKATMKPVPVSAFRAYYRTFDTKDFGPVKDALPIIMDTRLVTKPGESKQSGWFCGQFNPQPLGPSLPTCDGIDKPGHRLGLHITFPSCWDGVYPHHESELGDTRDNAHYRYPQGSVCPVGFPKHVVQLRLDVSYGYWKGNAAKDLVLSSDLQDGTTAGRSVHGDFWNTWVVEGFNQMIKDCITSGSLKPAFPHECD